MTVGKFIGCVMLVVGTAIGAGILASPIQCSGAGFIWSMFGVLTGWVVLTFTGLLLLEMNLSLPIESCTYGSMAAKTLGTPGRIITWISYLLLLYSIVAAYVAGESSMLTHMLESVFNITIPHYMVAILFVVILGSAVFWSTKAVDFVNRGFISAKGIFLMAAIVLSLPYVNVEYLIVNPDIGRLKYLFIASPIFLHMFNFHFVVPSIRMYVGDKPATLKWIIITGTTVSLVIYTLWLIASLGVVPLTGEYSFTSLAHLDHPADNPDFVQVMTTIVNNKWVTASINGFFNFSMTTSFLGVSLGLFDFLADGFKRKDTHFGRFQTACLTFIPPIIFALFYPHGFRMALIYAASFIAILCLILPPLMVYRLRKSTELKSPYRVFGNNFLFFGIVIIGLFLFVLPILTNLHLLPEIQ